MQIIIKYFAIFILNALFVYSFKLNFNELNEYLDNEKSILHSFDKYLLSEDHRISRLRQIYNDFKQQNSISMNNKDIFLSHPNDVYLLIKRIAIEWKTVTELLEPNKELRNKLNMRNYTNRFKFQEIVEDYGNIIYYYELNINSAANGVITYKTSSGEQKVFKSLSNQLFNAFDCYSMGKQSFKNEDYFSARKWLTLALNRTDNITTNQTKADILGYLSLTEYHSENYYLANELINRSVNLLSDRTSIESLLRNLFIKMIKNGQDLDKDYVKIQDVQIEKDANDSDIDEIIPPDLATQRDYMCLGRIHLNESMQSKLKCFYLNTTLKPYLRLTRVRVEELYKRPQIVLIHNFLSHTEIDTLKQISKSQLTRKMVQYQDGDLKYDTVCTAQRSFLKDDYHPVTSTLTRRISEITGLDASDKSADLLTVMQYTIGGQYNVHYDVDTSPLGEVEDRMVTWMNYLSDVDAGGATVFPKLNVTVWPERGSALLWYNLLNSLTELDDNLDHSACPVLYGTKWLAIKWIRVSPQNRDKCSLDRKEMKILKEATV